MAKNVTIPGFPGTVTEESARKLAANAESSRSKDAVVQSSAKIIAQPETQPSTKIAAEPVIEPPVVGVPSIIDVPTETQTSVSKVAISATSIPPVQQQPLDMPQVKIRTITLNENSKERKAKIRFHFDLPIDEENGKLYEVVPEFMNIKLVQVKNEKVFSFLNLSKELLWYSSNPSKMKSLPQILLNISKEIKMTKKASGEQLQEVFINKRNINHFSYSIKNMTAIARREQEGKINLEYEVEVAFDKKIAHLSYYIYPEFDIDKMRENGIRSNIDMQKIKVNSEIVLNGGKKIPQTYVLYLQDRNTNEKIIWNGFAHYDRSKSVWMTGRETDSDNSKRTLSRQIFFNTKIKDETVFDRILKITKSKDNRPPRRITEITSPIRFGTITPDGNTFLVNTELLLEKHSGFYKYLSSIETKNRDIVKSAKVYRKRVKELFKNVSDYNENQPKEYLKQEQIIIDRTNEINTITILEEDIGIGKYCYGVEIILNDILKRDMEITLEALKQNSSFLSNYLEQANIKDRHYDSEKNRFTEQFQAKYETERNISKSVEVYLEALLKVSSISSISQEIKKEILLHISPKYGTPQGVSRFISIYEKLIGFYTAAIREDASFGIYEEKKYFNRLEQVVEYEKVILNTQNETIYQTFSSNNSLAIKKEIGSEKAARVGENNVWENMLEKSKNEIVSWINSSKQIMNQIPYENKQQKYKNAINILNGFTPSTSTGNMPTGGQNLEIFYTTQKSNKQTIQEDLSSLFLSINSTPKNNSSGDISDRKITEIMNIVSDSNRRI